MESIEYLIFNFLVALLIAKPVITLLKDLKSNQAFREKGASWHIESKSGTPTLGGLIFLIPFFISTVYLCLNEQDSRIAFVIFAFAVGGALGFLDDFLKIVQKNHKGVDSKWKLLAQFLAVAVIVFFVDSRHSIGEQIPMLANFDLSYELVIEYIWAFIVIAGTSNAINLTDGLDGLASGISVISFITIGTLLQSFGDMGFYSLCLAIVGGLLAFLIFNKKPAEIFMGDTGSLALGMGLGTLAYINNLEWYLLIFALVPVIETLSVMLQVLSAKFSRKFRGKDWRPFKMAPLHHHFELCGMPEGRVVQLFWTVQFVVAVGFLVYHLKLS